MIIPGSASQSLAAALGDELDVPLAPPDIDTFPDGELIVQVPQDVPDVVVIVSSIISTDTFLEVILLQDAARETGARHVVTVIPYLGYARQDRAFERGQPISVRAVARAVSTGCDHVLTVDPHEAGVMDHFTAKAHAVSGASVLAEPLPGDLDDPVFFAPDAGAIDLIEEVQAAYGRGDIDHFEKTRHSGRDVELAPSDAEVAGRDVVVADDIIATGGTMSQALQVLRSRDAQRVFLACVHPMFTGSAYGNLARVGPAAIFGTDTIEHIVSDVSVAPVLADRITDLSIWDTPE